MSTKEEGIGVKRLVNGVGRVARFIHIFPRFEESVIGVGVRDKVSFAIDNQVDSTSIAISVLFASATRSCGCICQSLNLGLKTDS